MNDYGIKRRAGIYFKILISCCVGIALLIITYFILQIPGTLDIRYDNGGGYFNHIAAILLLTEIFAIIAFAGNSSIALCARSINSNYDAFFIGGLSGAVTCLVLGVYSRSLLLLILLLPIGLIFGLMGSIAFILLDKEYLGSVAVSKNNPCHSVRSL